MAQPLQNSFIALDEYLELERQSLDRHEYFQGNIYLLAGGSPNHSLIASNLNRALGNALAERPCRVFTSDLQVLVKANGLVTYPDVSVVCDPMALSAEDANLVTNPVLIVEVLLPSTASYDQTAKFQLYKGLDSLKDYVLADSRAVSVTHFYKQGPNEWVQRVYTELSEELALENLGIALSLSQLYAKVEFDPEPRLLR